MNKAILLASISLLAFSCSHAAPERKVAQEDVKKAGGETGNPLIGGETGNPFLVCMGNLEKELSPNAITNDFGLSFDNFEEDLAKVNKVYNDRPDKVADSANVENILSLCNAKVEAFSGRCAISKKALVVIAYPILTKEFLKNYRAYFICNRMLKCQQQVAFDESISKDAFKKIQEIYQSHHCQ